jgi:hypothetical protein
LTLPADRVMALSRLKTNVAQVWLSPEKLPGAQLESYCQSLRQQQHGANQTWKCSIKCIQ